MAGSESFLQYRHRNSLLPPAVFSNTNGLLEQVGNNFGTDWSAIMASPNNSRHMNLVVEWEGELYALGRTAANRMYVYKYDPSTGDWNTDSPELLNLGFGGRQIAANLGLHPIEVDGIPYLYCIYQDGDSNNKIWVHIRKQSRFKGDGSWSATVSQTLSTAAADAESDDRGMYGDMLIDENKLYTCFPRSDFAHAQGTTRAGAIGTLLIFNFKTRMWAELPHAGASGYGVGTQGQASLIGPTAFAKFKGTVYQLAREGYPEHTTPFNGTNILIQSFPEGVIGGKIEQVLIGDMDQVEGVDHNTLGVQNWGEGRYCMFVDRQRDKLFAIGYIRGSGAQGAAGTAGQAEDGWACWQLDQDTNGDLINEGEVGHQCLPPAVRAGITTRVGNPAQSLRWTSYDIVDASGNTEVFIELAGGGATTDLVNTYRWVGPDTEMEFQGQGGGGDFSVPLINGGGGEGIFSERHPFDVVIGTNPSGGQDIGEVTLTSRIVGGSGQTVDIRWFYAADSGDIPNLVCTIKDASSGTISSNVLTNVVADSGIEYSVTWEAAVDGIPANSFFAVKSSAVIV